MMDDLIARIEASLRNLDRASLARDKSLQEQLLSLDCELARRLNEMGSLQHYKKAADVHNRLRGQLSDIHERSKSYTSLVMAGGYAGFITLLVASKPPVLPSSGWLLAGFFIGISITVFVLHEVVTMLVDAHYHERFEKVIRIDSVNEEARVELWNELHFQSQAVHRYFWKKFFYPSLITGVLAASIYLTLLLWQALVLLGVVPEGLGR